MSSDALPARRGTFLHVRHPPAHSANPSRANILQSVQTTCSWRIEKRHLHPRAGEGIVGCWELTWTLASEKSPFSCLSLKKTFRPRMAATPASCTGPTSSVKCCGLPGGRLRRCMFAAIEERHCCSVQGRTHLRLARMHGLQQGYYVICLSNRIIEQLLC